MTAADLDALFTKVRDCLRMPEFAIYLPSNYDIREFSTDLATVLDTLRAGAAEAARDDGIDKTLVNNASWFDKASNALEGYARVHAEFTGEEARLALAPVVGESGHHNAWGALVMAAVKRRIIVKTGEYRQMTTAKSHARATPVYRLA